MASVSPWSVAGGKIKRLGRPDTQAKDDGMLHAEVSGARSKNTGMVYRAEKPR